MFLFDGTEDAKFTILLAHGAGGPMDSPSLSAMSRALAARGLRIARFDSIIWPPVELVLVSLSSSRKARSIANRASSRP
jgi:hypothetical protein